MKHSGRCDGQVAVQTLKDVLEHHQQVTTTQCACGWTAGSTTWHAEHVVNKVAPLLADAWEEGFNSGVGYSTVMHLVAVDAPVNPYQVGG